MRTRSAGPKRSVPGRCARTGSLIAAIVVGAIVMTQHTLLETVNVDLRMDHQDAAFLWRITVVVVHG